MDASFSRDEQLYRAVLPKDMFWEADGTVSSAAFSDRNGLSVDRGDYRADKEVIKKMMDNGLKGAIIKVTVGNCEDVSACVQYMPIPDNIYHSEIHGTKEKKYLTRGQRKKLAAMAVKVTTC